MKLKTILLHSNNAWLTYWYVKMIIRECINIRKYESFDVE